MRSNHGADPTPRGGRAAVLGGGLLAGVVAGLILTLTLALLRALLGIPSPAEMLGDVAIPRLNLDQFFALLGRFGGGNGIKRAGIGSVLVGQVAAGAAIGALYGAIVERERVRDPERRHRLGLGQRGVLFAAAAGATLWALAIVPLWPVLGTNYAGLPQGAARPATAFGLLAAYAAFGLALVLAHRALTSPAPLGAPEPLGRPLGRRALLVGGVGALAGVAAVSTLKALYDRSSLGYDGTRYRGPAVAPIAPNDRFYTVTKNILDPDPNRDVWRLDIVGRVDRPRAYRFADLAALPAIEQETTVSCISNEVGDGLISNAVWRGVPLRTLLDAAGPRPGTVKVVCHGLDNYVDTLPLDKALDPATFVAWEMNGAPLPRRHGYPVRLIVPGRFGEKSVKWLTRIELVDHDVAGFYERQGWGPTFVTPTLARFDSPADGQTLRPGADGAIALRGIAFAGDRGVARVEVSADDGRTWQDVRLDYRHSRLTWALWSLAWRPAAPGDYRLAVRATDENGTVQTAERRNTVPDGATGYHRLTVRVEA